MCAHADTRAPTHTHMPARTHSNKNTRTNTHTQAPTCFLSVPLRPSKLGIRPGVHSSHMCQRRSWRGPAISEARFRSSDLWVMSPTRSPLRHFADVLSSCGPHLRFCKNACCLSTAQQCAQLSCADVRVPTGPCARERAHACVCVPTRARDRASECVFVCVYFGCLCASLIVSRNRMATRQ